MPLHLCVGEFTLVPVKVRVSGQIGHFASELDHMVGAPSYHLVYGKAGLESIFVLYLSILDPTAAFQGAVKYLNCRRWVYQATFSHA